jgi:hypothetical protein
MGIALPANMLTSQKGYRLVNSRLPTIQLFDDVASAEDFEDLYDLQALTNPRLTIEIGKLAYIDTQDMPWGIPGCSYAVAPFTHVSPDGSRFSNGDYGMLYIADTMDTAIKEVAYHQQVYISKVEGLEFDRLIFRGLSCVFSGDLIHDATTIEHNNSIYDADSYTDSRALGAKLRADGSEGVQYWSVRAPGQTCWGLFTPKKVTSIVQTSHFEFITNGRSIVDIRKLSNPDETF